jgi:predicted lipoprotein with Yx(FWY)xxD motif
MEMKKLAMILAAVGVIALGIGTAIGNHHAVKIQDKAGIGKYFTDTEGKTLYWFKKDAPGKSSCNGPCLEKWPIYYREKVAAPKGVKGADFGTITRDDGKKQTTFRGYPIYYFINDKSAGDTTGQGVNDVWSVFNPDNFPPK